ncbi:H/ACA ribonucleoprotein complex non-core subunit NAF1 [Macadamia integrifolia]|uniref:H/ACA ribonucleoprotein complex non-core subunit NAF1 n=1 Tax=Macadamia integrifolia TaxID=60698 RepID=UPI001C4F0BAE|nr:H/ACA ribonucleoprotein complex non-core subunit NAF1 [Macadamia integrifolia]
MVGFDPSTEDLCKASPKLSKPVIADNPLATVLDDFCPPMVVKKFTDFDSIDDWVVDYDPIEMPIGGNDHCPHGSVTNTIVEETLTGIVPGGLESENLEELDGKGSDECVAVVQDNGSGINTSVEKTLKGTADEKPSVEGAVPGELEHFGSQLEEEMGKLENLELLDEKGSDECREVVQSVTVGVQNVTEETEVAVNGELGFKVSLVTNVEKPEAMTGVSGSESVELSDGDESDSSSGSESDSSSSSSSFSSSSEEEDEEEEEEDKRDTMEVGEIEEGEIRDLDNGIAAESDNEEGEGVLRRPIRSNNELEILPPVPHVDVALEPHHQTVPVGVISSIMGTKVVVEGLEKHNPLNEGSIIWITEARLPLGLVDEIFGPVKNPYYVVRYNSDEELPARIHEGTLVSFVEAFANHALNDKNLYRKGYDASGENDEEFSDEVEFSDDEKEAEYRRMQRMAKRGTDDRQHVNQDLVDRKKYQQKGEFQKKIHPSATPDSQPPAYGSQP